MSNQPSMLDVNPSARRDEDFYATPKYQVRALLRRFPQLCTMRLIEPCVGDGAIVRELPDANWITNDVVVRDPMLPDFLLDARARGSWQAFQATGPIDVAATNPPFNFAFDIAEQAYEHVERALILLLRLSWLEPTKDRGPWLAAHPPTRLIVLPRHDYRGNGSTDSVTSAWMVFAKDPAFCTPGIEVVSWRERDELMRAA